MSTSASVVLTGDTILQRRLSPVADSGFKRAVEAVRSADAGFTNLEGCVQAGEDWHAYVAGNGRGATYIRTPPFIGEELVWMGMRLLSLANNHSADFGESGYLTTLTHLSRWPELHVAGIGATLADATAPTYFEAPNGVVAMIAAADYGPRGLGDLSMPPPLGVMAADADRYFRGRPGVNLLRYDCAFSVSEETLAQLRRISEAMGWERSKGMRRGGGGRAEPMAAASPASDEVDDDATFYFMGRKFVPGEGFTFRTESYRGDIARIEAAVREAKRQADWVIVSLHQQGAGRSREEPPDHTVELGRAALGAGADVFVAHGAGRVGGIERVGSGVAVYGQGSFAMNLDQVRRLPLEMLERFGFGYDQEAGELLERRANQESRVGTEVGTQGQHAVRHLSSMTLVELATGREPAVTVLPLELGGAEEGRWLSGVPRLVATDGETGASALAMIADRCRPFGTTVGPDGRVGPAA